ncbi:hypothetical protein [Streptomyces sp. NPDC002952]|uniref:hypothetical protein n=1 Tax=Streptomyces sp. NPDC002952 TaxID=3364673 RepID=UPI0036A4648C
MTETLHTPARPYAADSPLAYLLDLAAEAIGPSEDEQRDDAQTTAAHHIYQDYPGSLSQVLDATDWQGFPAWTGAGGRHEPSAVAWLDGGLWLHHTVHISERHGASDALTLMVPCTCTHGYVDIRMDTEGDLVDLLAELRPTRGYCLHTETPVGCRSIHTGPFLRGHD